MHVQSGRPGSRCVRAVRVFVGSAAARTRRLRAVAQQTTCDAPPYFFDVAAPRCDTDVDGGRAGEGGVVTARASSADHDAAVLMDPGRMVSARRPDSRRRFGFVAHVSGTERPRPGQRPLGVRLGTSPQPVALSPEGR